MNRPDFSSIKNGAEFNKWYWLKEEMVAICKLCQLPYSGRKFELRDRIMYALDNDGAVQLTQKKAKQSKFNWARAELNLDTLITDNVSFGPNFRQFMQAQIGKQFSCNTDFMAWVRANPGKTLQDAVLIWQELENRKTDPNFKKTIAASNMFNQYIRDFLADNKGRSFKEAVRYWEVKKQMPMKDGFVRYKKTDLELL